VVQKSQDVTQPSPPAYIRHRWLLTVMLVALVVRVPGIQRPLTGNFATKNVVYAMIARNWAEGRAGLLEPTLDCLVGGQRSLHLLEFPVSAYVSGLGWRSFGGSLELWGRLTSVTFSLAAIALLYLLVARWHGTVPAIVAGLALALSPVAILYGRSFMVEASLVCFAVATLWAWDHWLASGRWAWLATAGLALALALLTKVFLLILLAPMAAMAWSASRSKSPSPHRIVPLTPAPLPQGERGSRMGSQALLGAFVVATALVPAGLWYWHAAAVATPGSPVAERVYYSVRTSAEIHRPPHPLLGTMKFYGRMTGDLCGVVLTPLGFVLLIAGLLNAAWWRHAVWLAACLLLIVVLPRKFFEMNYYWMAVLPALAVIVGLGWQLVEKRLRPGRIATAGCLVLSVLLAARYTIGPMLRIAEEDRGVVAAGQIVQRFTTPEERVVTMHGSTIDLLYYCRRPGWALDTADPKTLAACVAQGARVLAIAGAEPLTLGPWPGIPCQTLARGPGYAVFCIARP
jgi:4-amino-4-deoxy-L-arabinose transferase-like glycosyltransferase